MEQESDSLFYQLKDSFKGIPRFTKTIICFVIFLFLIQIAFPSTRHVLALTADFIFASPFSFIQLFTAGFLEVNIITLCINCVLFAWLGKYLEPIWGTKEFMKFIFLNDIGTTITSYCLVIILFIITGKDPSLLYHYFWCGFSGITCGLLVAIKQLNPEFGIYLFFFYLRAKFIPSLIVLLMVGLMFAGISLHAAPFVLLGISYSWIYLRFLQRKGDVVGDLNETFALSSFFPEAVGPIVDAFSGVVYNILNLCGVWRWLGVSAKSTTTSVGSKSDSAAAERRRKKSSYCSGEKIIGS